MTSLVSITALLEYLSTGTTVLVFQYNWRLALNYWYRPFPHQWDAGSRYIRPPPTEVRSAERGAPVTNKVL
jgi:hypothetical protein